MTSPIISPPHLCKETGSSSSSRAATGPQPRIASKAELSAPQRAMLIASGPDDITGREGTGVELRTGADYAVAKALERRELGYVEGPGGPLCGLYFNNAEGLSWRREELGDDPDQGHDSDADCLWGAAMRGPVAPPEIGSEPSALLEAAQAVLKAQADFKSWAEAGVMRGLLPYTEADLRKASLEAFDKLRAAVAEATGQ